MEARYRSHLTRFSAAGLGTVACHADIRLGRNRVATLYGDGASAVLRLMFQELSGRASSLAGSRRIEIEGDSPRVEALMDPLPEAERARLHATWAEILRSKSSEVGRRLRSAWQLLWGDSTERLWAPPGQDSVIMSTSDRSPKMPPWLRRLDSRGSGYVQAFDLLGQVVLTQADLVLVDRPERCLHPLVAKHVVRVLALANPDVQIVAALCSGVCVGRGFTIPIPTCQCNKQENSSDERKAKSGRNPQGVAGQPVSKR